MKTSLIFENKLTMLAQMTNDSRFQVLEYENLRGVSDIDTSLKLNVLNKSNIRLKQIRIILDHSKIKIENGLLSYMKGDIKVNNKCGRFSSLSKKLIASNLDEKEVFKPTYEGKGEIFLQPSFNNYALIELEDDNIVLEEGKFLTCEEGVYISPISQKTSYTSIFKEEDTFQSRIYGSGIVVIELPVPEEEIFKCKLNRDTLKVEGSFAILRTGDIEVSVEKYSTSSKDKERFINVYKGTGDVWLAPTKSIYEKINDYTILGNMNDDEIVKYYDTFAH